MRHYKFFKKSEIELAKKENRLPLPIWGIECDQSELKRYLSIYDLYQDWIYID